MWNPPTDSGRPQKEEASFPSAASLNLGKPFSGDAPQTPPPRVPSLMKDGMIPSSENKVTMKGAKIAKKEIGFLIFASFAPFAVTPVLSKLGFSGALDASG